MTNLLQTLQQLSSENERLSIAERARVIVEHLLGTCSISRPPIPVESIAKYLGIDVRESPADDDISGALIRPASGQQNVVIALNESHHPNRKRFTISHELGHLLLHPGNTVHVDQNFRVNWRDQESSSGINWQEVEANKFAAELLIPTRFIIDDIDTATLDDDSVMALARRYKVSEVAMRNRLVNLGIVDPF
jgi:hypothetical protein